MRGTAPLQQPPPLAPSPHLVDFANFVVVLHGDDETDDQAVEPERGRERPDEHHANVQLGLPRGVAYADVAAHANGEARGEVAQADGHAGREMRVAARAGGRGGGDG
eukprot:CAMPEP_0179886326 /NCGR_PEP_ID=MMETSP0982-20121206/30783_1 /TAXON_ID=483367 /ORGANISM="non described non described, Strain CCMP 2436" /LENGTH=106 /DNA_ID=CAMNT_0021782023 /DNA_START=319 /DNA_END=640 /DNA_ORIENTATION=+